MISHFGGSGAPPQLKKEYKKENFYPILFQDGVFCFEPNTSDTPDTF